MGFPQAPRQTVNIVAEPHEVEVPEVQAVAEVLVVTCSSLTCYVASATQHPCALLRKV